MGAILSASLTTVVTPFWLARLSTRFTPDLEGDGTAANLAKTLEA